MSYNTIADYSEVLGGKLLPFVVELDIPNCVLVPEPGYNQKFSYTVTAVGSNADENLSYLILGMDENITADQIKNISVIIDGKAEKVHYNTGSANVALVVLDAKTGCSGLKFTFALNRRNGVMQISFEITEAYEVGDAPVCLVGNSSVKTGLTIGGPVSSIDGDEDDEEHDDGWDDEEEEYDEDGVDDDKDDDDEDKDDDVKKCFHSKVCEKSAHKIFDISMPISVKPFAIPRKPEVMCLGEPEIHHEIHECEHKRKSIDFTLKQKISVRTPVKFGVKTCCFKSCVENDEDEGKERKE